MLYFDESGYTGADLVNSKQPYFHWLLLGLQMKKLLK